MNTELSVNEVDNIMESTKLVNIDRFTKEDWSIFMEGSYTGRVMMIHSLEEVETSKYNDALVMLEEVMGYNEFGEQHG